MTSQPPSPSVPPVGPTPPPQYAPYAQTPYPPQVYAAPPSRPGRVLGIVGFVLSFVFPLDIAGLVLSIIAMVQSRRAGQKNGFALAGIIIASVGILFCAAILALLIPPLIEVAQTCARLGTGVHEVGNAVYTCTPTSVRKSWH
ncbi:DUF4190 domain-containing protein [Leifsonia sp. NPDC080035]|uniref:DUF4190 domain-containing protein n=1 Tax=Leifsonia sp. NPDC080035 TaxID=3143936 RepID=A0AAU7GGD8_9MICO